MNKEREREKEREKIKMVFVGEIVQHFINLNHVHQKT